MSNGDLSRASATGAPLRLAVDTGGTFTDLVVEGDPRGLRFFKRATTPDDPVEGLLDVLSAAGEGFGCSHRELLARTDLFVFGKPSQNKGRP